MYDPVILFISELVLGNGVQIAEHTWRYKAIEVNNWNGLIEIMWGPRLNVYQRENEEPIYNAGTFDDLMVIYSGLTNAECADVE